MSHRNQILPPLTLGVVREIKTRTGVDLLRAYDPEVAARLESDPVFVARAYAIATKDEKLAEDLAGEDLAQATSRLIEALVEFFPKRSIYDEFIDENAKSSPGEVDPWRVVFRAAGIAGLDPWGYSLREIIWAAQGAFEPYATILTQWVNSHAKKQTDRTDADTVNPWHPKRPRPKRTRSQNGPSKS